MEIFEELNLIGEAPAFREALSLIARYADCPATVLISGETGTGKELAARAIHYLGPRRNRPFIPINCGALPDSLVENELFGHSKGAFTDGRESTRGLVGDAEGGTLFLDEVEALSPKAQVSLLRFLQDGFFRPLGARQPIKADVRVIAATNLELGEIVAAGEFRSDLMYRLQVATVRMPTLRERREDIPRLAAHFLQRFSRQYGAGAKMLAEASVPRLTTYGWPGNVRELENVMHRSFILSDTHLVRVQPEFGSSPSTGSTLEAACSVCYDLGFRRAKERVIEEFERSFVRWALSESRGNVSEAARRCDKERRTFGRLIKKYGIDRLEYL
ncbi:sigma-54 interaction domain-containing protein [Methylolobus aquaticus]